MSRFPTACSSGSRSEGGLSDQSRRAGRLRSFGDREHGWPLRRRRGAGTCRGQRNRPLVCGNVPHPSIASRRYLPCRRYRTAKRHPASPRERRGPGYCEGTGDRSPMAAAPHVRVCACLINQVEAIAQIRSETVLTERPDENAHQRTARLLHPFWSAAICAACRFSAGSTPVIFSSQSSMSLGCAPATASSSLQSSTVCA